MLVTAQSAGRIVSVGIDLESYKKRVGKKIRKRREELGFDTQTDLAKAFLAKSNGKKVDRTMISKWESGAQLPKGKNRAKLLEILEVTEASIFGQDEPVENTSSLIDAKSLDLIRQAAREGAASYRTIQSPTTDYSTLSKPKRELIDLILTIPDDRIAELIPVARQIADSLISSDKPKNTRRR